jgi:[ribosomal protein S18]-alanine N-acetyltransferase
MSNSATTTKHHFTAITRADVDTLMPIELACHSHPWSEKTFVSCIGNRYFGEKLAINLPNDAAIGFYVGEYVLGEATLMDICVTPSEQGKGNGKVILNRFLAQAKKLGTTKVFLEVRAKNISAQMLYMNAGFIEISRRTGYYPSNSGFGYEDAIVMSMICK